MNVYCICPSVYLLRVGGKGPGRRAQVGIIGMGDVGLPYGERKFIVTGFDIERRDVHDPPG